MSRRRVADERRKEIIAGLYECLESVGYQELTIKSIARAANVSYGALHYFFKNKKEIVFAFVEDYTREAEDRFRKSVVDIESAPARLKAMVSFLVQEMVLKSKINKVFLNLHHMACCDDDIRGCMRRCHEAYRRGIREVIEYGIRRGEFPKIDTATFAFLMVGTVEGVSLQISMNPELLNVKKVEKLFYHVARRLLIGEETLSHLSRLAGEEPLKNLLR
ncbi:MAG: TetR/AcrR family transcriptional regulator [bacterium]